MGVRLLGKMKLYELAKEMDVPSKELLEQAKELGINIKSHLSAISDEDIKNLKDKYQRKGASNTSKKEEKKPKKESTQNSQKKDNPVIIRREVIIEEDGNEREHIFDRFYQIEEGKNKGFGIGLNLSREIISIHQGTLQVVDSKKEGTTFEFRIPKMVAKEADKNLTES